MAYHPDLHHRRSIRLPDFDYASEGWYFITLCTQNRDNLFGEIQDDKPCHNPAGEMINHWWNKITEKFKGVVLGEYVIMPNHFHALVYLPETEKFSEPVQKTNTKIVLSQVVRWFKTMTTNEYIRRVKAGEFLPFEKRIWHRNYFERVVRNQEEFDKIDLYIRQNPEKWVTHPDNLNILLSRMDEK